MRVLFRCDASDTMGSGHVMRCSTLAQGLVERGATCHFVSQPLSGNLNDWLGEQGLEVFTSMPTPAKPYDWLIVDHYQLAKEWETTHAHMAQQIMVIDDLANRPHHCDVLLDQNWVENPQQRYKGLTSDKCKLLLGPEYALLRPEFIEERMYVQQPIALENMESLHILVFFGGSDPTGETTKVLQALEALARRNNDCASLIRQWTVTVVTGRSNPIWPILKAQCYALRQLIPNTWFYCQTPHMAQMMAQANISLGACGSTTWERCAMGLPTWAITTAHNQQELATAVAKTEALQLLGSNSDIAPWHWEQLMEQWCENPARFFAQHRHMQAQALGLVDANGVSRVLNTLYGVQTVCPLNVS